MSQRQRNRRQPPPSGRSPAGKAGARGRTPQRLPASLGRPWWQHPAVMVGGAVALIAVLVVVVVLVTRGGGSPAGIDDPVPASVAAGLQPSAGTLASVGTGGLPDPLQAVRNPTPLTGAGGRPQVLYVGADYCPFCAAERWSLIIALSRFGTFSNLHLMASTDADVYPNTPTFTFHGSTYSSQYLDFRAIETETRDRQALDTVPDDVRRLVTTYDAPPYSQTSGGIPFVDYGGRFLTVSSGYIPDVLDGHTWQQVTDLLAQPGSAQAKAVLGNANYLTAAMCALTGGRPGSVCGSPPVSAITLPVPR